MLSHKVLTRQDVGRPASYYEDGADDYYANEGEASEWQGKGAAMRGASLKAVQELLGHESIEMTLRYSHVTPDVKREAVRLLDRTENPGDIRETAEAEKETPRRSGGLDGAGKGI